MPQQKTPIPIRTFAVKGLPITREARWLAAGLVTVAKQAMGTKVSLIEPVKTIKVKVLNKEIIRIEGMMFNPTSEGIEIEITLKGKRKKTVKAKNSNGR
jgi:hypothetical protein